MFEVSGDDISSLSDADLRSLVVRLAIAELRAKGHPRSAVTAGGNQDAADGGLDVRVECPSAILDPDFVPRRLTGFQVKKPNMPASAIRGEMRPNDVLRSVIRELADGSGAYVIVSAQGSVADKPLGDRRQAMRDALHDLATAGQLHTEFYDRDRLAIWANEFPGIVTWVRSRVGRPLSGWRGIGAWEDGGGDHMPYLSSDKACLIDEHSRDRECLAVGEGITRLRATLRKPQQCVRLIGLSGLGKTRLVQALFEEGVGDDPLDPSLAVYTDYSEETNPTAREMARDLISRRQRAILVVDNCNPATHSELARLCANGASEVSLITVEYDVRDDEPEHTKVFRLQSASLDLVSAWTKRTFPDISPVDCQQIAAFSDGNFRVARALAETLGKGETLGSLKSRELFERIFHQRNIPDQQLLKTAQDLSLLYSIDGEDVSEGGELGRVGHIRGIGATPLYEALAELRQRGVVQVRGRFRAILPQAIANNLAALALERIPPGIFDQFCATLTRRMLKSVSRRLGFLHDSVVAQATVSRWLRADGPLGDLIAMGKDGLEIITHIAPVVPEAVLAKLKKEIDGPSGHLILAPDAQGRHQWIRLIKALGYDEHMFDDAAMLVARFHAAEPEGHHIGRDAFGAFFHFSLSGTRATPLQRHAAIKRFALSGNPDLRRCAHVALDELLKSGYFMSTDIYDFGSRSRDWGWSARINRDVWDWFNEAIALALELAPHLADARTILAHHVRSLWQIAACHEALDHAAAALVQDRPWLEGWLAFRAARRFDGKGMPEDVRARLERIIDRLKPSDLLNRARAVVLNRASGGSDFADGEDDAGDAMRSWDKADKMAKQVGQLLAHDAAVRAKFLAEVLIHSQAPRAFECGRGLAEGADDLCTMWSELVMAHGAAEHEKRNATVLGGFLQEAHQRDAGFVAAALEAVIDNPHLAPVLPYLQARVGIDEQGIARLRRAIARGVVVAADFYRIANGVVAKSPPEPLAELLADIATLPDGIVIALDILHMHFCPDREEDQERNLRIVAVGRDLLARVIFSKKRPLTDYGTHTSICICLAGEEGRSAAEKMCANIRTSLETTFLSSHELSYTLKALFETQAFAALDAFFLPSPSPYTRQLFNEDFGIGSPIKDVDPVILQRWADREPAMRYPLLGDCVSMFAKQNGEEENEFSPLFLTLLEHAPDKRKFLGSFYDRVHPRGWSGSLAVILIRRKAQLMKLAEHPAEDVRAWAADSVPELDRWIEHERGRDRVSEESFE